MDCVFVCLKERLFELLRFLRPKRGILMEITKRIAWERENCSFINRKQIPKMRLCSDTSLNKLLNNLTCLRITEANQIKSTVLLEDQYTGIPKIVQSNQQKKKTHRRRKEENCASKMPLYSFLYLFLSFSSVFALFLIRLREWFAVVFMWLYVSDSILINQKFLCCCCCCPRTLFRCIGLFTSPKRKHTSGIQ